MISLKRITRSLKIIAVMFMYVAALGCNDSGGGGGIGNSDPGDNDINLYIAFGDSITQGNRSPGPPWPARLSSKIGKPVTNSGRSGDTSGDGRSRVGGVLSRKPGFVLIMFGSNDAIHGIGSGTVKANLRAIVQACKGNKTTPVLATVPPMRDGHKVFNGAANSINNAIRQLAGEEGIPLIDIGAAFGSGEGLLVADGLHPNSAGLELIAQVFAGAL